MQISARGILAIEKEEGLRLDSYPDPATGADPWTIGFGHTGSIKRGDKITVEQAREYLQADLKRVEDCINSTVIVLLTQGQFDALCSLIFNIGIGAFRNSTLLRKLNASDYQGAAAQFGVWIKAGGIDYPPLVARRARERAVYDADPVIPAAVPIPIPQTQPFPFPSRFEGDDLIL